MSNSAIITLQEGDFLQGTAVLYNSLCHHGLNAPFIIGYREGQQPSAVLKEKMESQAVSSAPIHWRPWKTDWHFTNFKAQALLDIFQEYKTLDTLFYFDPDIVVNCSWEWMASWPISGPTLCADVNWQFPPEHPTRRAWKKALSENGLKAHQSLNYYLNGGFLGLSREDLAFAQNWNHLIKSYGSQSNNLKVKGDIGRWRVEDRSHPFHSLDQDALNCAAMAWENDLCLLGPDAMDFAPGWKLLPHALGSNKPWRAKYLLRALDGRPPRLVDNLYWDFASGPIQVHSPTRRRLKKTALSIGRFVSRFYRR